MLSESAALLLTFTLNVPFGYWRSGAAKWFLAIHSPVPLVFLFRILSAAPLYHIPAFIVAFFVGQSTGSKLRNFLAKKMTVSKCFVLDLARFARLKLLYHQEPL